MGHAAGPELAQDSWEAPHLFVGASAHNPALLRLARIVALLKQSMCVSNAACGYSTTVKTPRLPMRALRRANSRVGGKTCSMSTTDVEHPADATRASSRRKKHSVCRWSWRDISTAASTAGGWPLQARLAVGMSRSRRFMKKQEFRTV